jgi:hypothetical protein
MVTQEVEKVFPTWVDTASDGYERLTLGDLKPWQSKRFVSWTVHRRRPPPELPNSNVKTPISEERSRNCQQP